MCNNIQIPGFTLERFIWILGKSFTRGLGHVACGKATLGSGLYIVRNEIFQHFSESQMNDFQDRLYDIHEVYEYLRQNKRLES